MPLISVVKLWYASFKPSRSLLNEPSRSRNDRHASETSFISSSKSSAVASSSMSIGGTPNVGECNQRHENSDRNVEVNCGPTDNGLFQVQDNKWSAHKAKCKLRHDPAHEIVVLLGWLGRFLIGFQEDWAQVSPEHFANSSDESTQDKRQVISWPGSVPEGAGGESHQRTLETRFLSLFGKSGVDVMLQPLVGIHVPGFETFVGILTELESPGVDVLHSVPLELFEFFVVAVVADTTKDARALCN